MGILQMDTVSPRDRVSEHWRCGDGHWTWVEFSSDDYIVIINWSFCFPTINIRSVKHGLKKKLDQNDNFSNMIMS